jgi:hypothetical protein
VSRARALALLLLPSLVATLIGYGAGNLLATWLPAPAGEPIVYVAQGENAGLRLPLRYFAASWSGEVPAITAPWGEAHRPDPLPVFGRRGPALYKPYFAPPEASEAYVAWQIERATAAVFQRRIPADEIRSRYLVTGRDGRVGLRGEALTLRADHPDLALRGARGPRLPVLLCGVFVVFYAALLIQLRTMRPLWPATAAKVTTLGLYALLLGGHLVPLALGLTRVVDLDRISVLATASIARVGDAGPWAVVLVWVAAVAIGLGGFRLAARSLERAELPVYPPDRS